MCLIRWSFPTVKYFFFFVFQKQNALPTEGRLRAIPLFTSFFTLIHSIPLTDTDPNLVLDWNTLAGIWYI